MPPFSSGPLDWRANVEPVLTSRLPPLWTVTLVPSNAVTLPIRSPFSPTMNSAPDWRVMSARGVLQFPSLSVTENCI